jgi:N-acetyl-gamma-glutamyl-phosphate reductase
MKNIKAGIIGATSYTGRELLSILLSHPGADIVWLTSQSRKREDYCRIYPQFINRLEKNVRELKSFEDVADDKPDVVFSCLPHGSSAEFLKSFINNGKTRIVDLSADFRLQDTAIYKTAYGLDHPVPEYVSRSQYGLCEIYEEKIRKADIIGNPGCYPTSLLLPLIPLLEAKLISPATIIADSKSGISGAGKTPTETTHFINCNESLKAYKAGDRHRHLSEVQEQLDLAADTKAEIIFVPHLIPMERGLLSTVYCDLSNGTSLQQAEECLVQRFKNAAFVHVVDHLPSTGEVRNTNNCHIHVYGVEKYGKILLFSVIDNLLKGASGQAVQNMNILFGFPETAGLV